MITQTVERDNYWGNSKAGYYLTQFDSIQDFVNLPKPTKNESNKKYWKSFDMNKKSTWLSPKGNSRKEIEVFSKNGWEYGSKKASKLIETISLPFIESSKRKPIKSDRGDELDIHKVYRGELNTAWRRTKRKSKKAPQRFSLICRIGGHCGISSDELMWRGVATLALATVLSKAGHAVEIKGYSMNTGVYPQALIKDRLDIITLKEFSKPLDIDSLSNVLALAGFFRHYMFKAWLQSQYACPSGLGRMARTKYKTKTARQSIKIDVLENQTRNKFEVEAFIKNTIDNL